MSKGRQASEEQKEVSKRVSLLFANYYLLPAHYYLLFVIYLK
jgi:hypothetical protein